MNRDLVCGPLSLRGFECCPACRLLFYCIIVSQSAAEGNPSQILQEEEVLPLFQWITHSLVRPSSMHVS